MPSVHHICLMRMTCETLHRCSEDGVEELVRLKSVECIEKAGKILGLALPLAGEGKKSFNGSWRDVH